MKLWQAQDGLCSVCGDPVSLMEAKMKDGEDERISENSVVHKACRGRAGTPQSDDAGESAG